MKANTIPRNRFRLSMKKSHAKSLKEYDALAELDSKKILAAMKRFKDAPKKPTSVALDEATIQELKAMAEVRGFRIKFSFVHLFWMDWSGLRRLRNANLKTLT